MEDFDQTIVTSAKTIQFKKFNLKPHLIVLYPQSQFKQFPLEVGSYIIGRGQDAQIRLDDELVSRKHCEISFDGKKVIVRDLNSTNGTYIDGETVEISVIESDQRLQIGKVILKIDFKDSDEEAFDRELFEAATMDALTKIPNRRTFFDRSLGELALARRNDCFTHTFMIDADHFKRINDTWGHQAGDMVLKEIARILKEEKRESDLLARYGGEEFIMLLAGISIEDAKKSAERLRSAIERHRFSWKDELLPVTISLGISSKKGSAIPKIEAMIAESDKMLYHAKENGRNQIAFAK